MLQKLNERIQGLVAWIVIVLIAITFTLFGVDYYMQARQMSDTKASVNSESITERAFEVNYRRARYQHDISKLTAALDESLKKQVLDRMIMNEVLVQAARKTGFEISPEQANAAIINIPQFQEDGHFSEARFQQALSGALYTPDTFQTEVRQGMLLNQQRFAFMGTAFALPYEIERFVRLYMQNREYDYLIIPAKAYAKGAEVSEEAVQAYYQDHLNEFVEPERVSIDYIRLSMPEVKNKIQVSDEEVNKYYEEYKNNFLTPAQWQVAHILFAVPKDADAATAKNIRARADQAYQTLENSPAEFDKLVQSESDDRLSRAQKGVLPWIIAGNTEYDKYLTGLSSAGQITPPVKTSHGYEIFKLLAYKPAQMKPLAQVKAQIIEQCKLEKAQTTFAGMMEKMGDLGYQTPDSLASVAKALDLPIEHSRLFTRKGSDAGVAKSKPVVRAAFSHDVLTLGNNSEPVQLDNDTVIILRVHKRLAAQQKPLQNVRGEIKTLLSAQKASQLAQQAGENAIKAKAPAASLAELAKDKQLKWQHVAEATRDNSPSMPEINELAFTMAHAKDYQGKALSNGDFIIVQLKNITDGKFDALDKEQKASLAQQIESNQGIMEYDLYVNQLMQRAKIVRSKA